jgi:hypothetical protein
VPQGTYEVALKATLPGHAGVDEAELPFNVVITEDLSHDVVTVDDAACNDATINTNGASLGPVINHLWGSDTATITAPFTSFTSSHPSAACDGLIFYYHAEVKDGGGSWTTVLPGSDYDVIAFDPNTREFTIKKCV